MEYVHNLDPFAIHFTGDIGIRWYGLAYLSGFFLGYALIMYLAKRKKINILPEKVGDFVTAIAIGTMVGGRIGYALFYKPNLFLEWNWDSFPFWGLLEVHKGGMASHGGILGIMVAAWIWGKRNKVSMFELIDLTVTSATVGIIFGRVANFINGELFGRVIEGTSKFAVKFPNEMYLWMEKGATEKLSSLYTVVEKLKPITYRGSELNPSKADWSAWADRASSISYAKMEAFIALAINKVQAGNEEITAALGQVLSARYPSQLYQALFEGLAVLLIVIFIWRIPRKPGVVSGWWAISYCVARIIGEQYRLPDSHLGFQALGLTRGQWISVGFLIAGIVYLAYNYKKDSEKIGGWLS